MTRKPNNTILIVDDEIVNLRMLDRLLRNKYRVLTADSGSAALEVLKQNDIALLITDQRMPGMTGIELLRASRSINPDLASMMVTAYTDSDTSVVAINDAGALRVIHKPWNPDTVLNFVDDALARRETLVECKLANAEIALALNKLKSASEELNLFSHHA